MITPFYLSSGPLNRNEKRKVVRYFVEVKVIGGQMSDSIDALTADVSDVGIGLLTSLPLPIGSKIEINMDGYLFASGEVIYLDQWDTYELFRIGILFDRKYDESN